MHRGGCLELYYCNMVEWSWWDSGLIWKTNPFPSVLCHCWFGHMTCKIVPEMTYNVSCGTLSLYTTYHTDALCRNGLACSATVFTVSSTDVFLKLWEMKYRISFRVSVYRHYRLVSDQWFRWRSLKLAGQTNTSKYEVYMCVCVCW